MSNPTPTPIPIPQRHLDHVSGLRYYDRIGPALPALNAAGLGYVRDDCLARAVTATRQAEQAWQEGNIGLVQRCEGIASAMRDTAAQIVAYALDPAWQHTEARA